ncbi:MAG: DNA-directed RNA polymerase subunit alpha [Caldilineales bacterium]|nr:DNA-directed RNA polymerase subunit alpha [Caldilineales bacterium]
MQSVLPRIECTANTQKYARFEIGPLEGGFGITLGNALRRVLLSALPGAAVTSVRINDVYHEFTPIPAAREDTTQLILNLKQLRLRLFSEEPVRIYVHATSPGPITAGDLNVPPEVEIVNPELYLLTLDSTDVDFDMELTVSPGKGYLPAEADNRPKLPIGEMPIDAIFSPVRRVNYQVERTRVGGHTDFDRLILDIWTDGAIAPEAALQQASRTLVELFSMVAGVELQLEAPEEESDSGIPARIADQPIEDLDLSMRAYNCLKRAGITKVGEVLHKLEQGGDDEMLAIRNFGRKSLDELVAKLDEKEMLQYIDYTPSADEE